MAYQWLGAMYAPYSQLASTISGVFFDPADLSPLVNNTAMAHVLGLYKRMIAVMHPGTRQACNPGATLPDPQPLNVDPLFDKGRCLMTINWIDQFKVRCLIIWLPDHQFHVSCLIIWLPDHQFHVSCLIIWLPDHQINVSCMII